jgi:hypothetical protein
VYLPTGAFNPDTFLRSHSSRFLFGGAAKNLIRQITNFLFFFLSKKLKLNSRVDYTVAEFGVQKLIKFQTRRRKNFSSEKHHNYEGCVSEKNEKS